MPDEQTNTETTAQTPPPVDMAALQAQVAALTQEVAEGQRTAEFWHQKATEKPEPARKEPPVATGDDDDPDLLELITTKGVKGLDALMAKRGYVRADQVDAKVNAKASQLTEEAKLVQQYPQLNDNNSEFFKVTATHYGTLKQQGVPEHMAMKLAAEKAELDLIRSGKIETPVQTTERKKKEAEETRQARIKAQAGPSGSRASEAEDSDELTPEQEQVAVRMLAGMTGLDGKPLTREQAIESYKARAKKGVAVKGGMK